MPSRGGRVYDFNAVFDNGAVLIRHRVNVWKISSFRYRLAAR